MHIVEYVTRNISLHQAQTIYIVVNSAIYAYTVYSCANNYYKTANTAFRLCRTGYVVSGSMYNKWLRWRYNATKPVDKSKQDKSKEIEMTDTVTTHQPVVYGTPSELHDLVENYFVSDS